MISTNRKLLAALAAGALLFPAAPAHATTTFTITPHTQATNLNDIVKVLTGSLPFTNAKLNGSSTADISRLATGVFRGGAELVGIESGLVVTASTNADALLDDFDASWNLVKQNANIIPAGQHDLVSPQGTDRRQTFLGPIDSTSLPGALLRSAQAGLLAPAAATSVESIVTLEFSLNPTDNFFKATFSLVVSEDGDTLPSSNIWDPVSAAIFFPDAVGIFVKEEGVVWDKSQNCAVIPTTPTFLSISSAGIVDNNPSGDVADMRAVAQSNYDALVAKTLDPTWNLSQISALASPPQIAYSTRGELGMRENFITVPLTCVVDVSSFRAASKTVEVGIVVANLNDDYAAPAIMIASDSIRFEPTAAASFTPSTPEQTQNSAPSAFQGPIATTPVAASAGQSVRLKGERLDTVTVVSIQGMSVPFRRLPSGELELEIPMDILPGTYDIVLTSLAGQVTLQGHLTVSGGGVPSSTKNFYTKRISNEQVKVYFFEPENMGKISFRVNGREFAWHESGTDEIRGLPILTDRFGRSYIVRTITLTARQKGGVEIFVDDERVWRAAYWRAS